MRRIFFKIFCLFIFFFVLKKDTQAAEFSCAYEVTYQVNDSGLTSVINKISLTNLKSDLYAKQYSVIIGSEKIVNVSGFDSAGPLELSISQKNAQTEIQAAFNEKVVGIGKILIFTLSYDSPDIATKQGRIWEINIPKPALDETISSYTITLSVPKSFGKAAYLKPPPKSDLTWVFSNNYSTSVTAAFGDFQSYDFDLAFHLKNNSLIPQIHQISLPPDTLHQKVILEFLSPTPQNVISDDDGNWLAQYQLFPKTSIRVSATGSAQVFQKKQPDYPLPKPLLAEGDYLNEQKFWEKDDEEIVKVAEELKTPERIYRYVVQNLVYDIKRVGEDFDRLGARQILKNPKKATCMEFADLFVTLCRAAQIPARVLNGFGLSDDPNLKPLSLSQDVLHAWAEYYDADERVWVPVDPTWEATTAGVDYFHAFDFNHLVFSIHGRSSELPVPPGGAYLANDDSKKGEKNIHVTVSEKSPIAVIKEPKVSIDFPKEVVAGRQIRGKVAVNNNGSQALYNLSLTVSSDLLAGGQEFKIQALPPFGHQTFDVNFPCQDIFFWGEPSFIFKLGEVEQKTTVFIKPLIVSLMPYLLGLSLLLIIVALGFLLYRRLYVNQ